MSLFVGVFGALNLTPSASGFVVEYNPGNMLIKTYKLGFPRTMYSCTIQVVPGGQNVYGNAVEATKWNELSRNFNYGKWQLVPILENLAAFTVIAFFILLFKSIYLSIFCRVPDPPPRGPQAMS